MTDPWECKSGLVFLILALLIAMGAASFDAHGETISFQTKDPSTPCPKPNPDATFSVSIWNSGGWPLWRKTCLYSDTKPSHKSAPSR